MSRSVIFDLFFLILFFLVSTFIGVWGATKYLVIAIQITFFSYALITNSKIKGLKLILFSAFLPGYIFQYVAIGFTFIMFRKHIYTKVENENKVIKYLFLWGGLSYLINQAVELNLLSFPFFILSFFLPMIFFPIFKNIGVKYKDELLYFLKLMSVVSFSMSFIQYFVLGLRVDNVTGGLKSAHVSGFIACIVFIIVIIQIWNFKFDKTKLVDIMILIFAIPVAYISDSKYILLFMVISLAVTFTLFGLRLWPRIVFTFILGSFIALNSFQVLIPESLSLSERDSGKNAVSVENALRLVSLSASGQLWYKTAVLYELEPWVFYVGAGPGTVLSRAANSRAFDTMNKVVDTYGVQSKSEQVESKLPSFIKAKTSWVTRKHIANLFQIDWNGSLYDYRSSAISFIWEFGIIGVLLFMLYIYKMYDRVRFLYKNSTIKKIKFESVSYFSLIIFFFLNAIVAYYFEYTHIQILIYSLAGLFFNKK